MVYFFMFIIHVVYIFFPSGNVLCILLSVASSNLLPYNGGTLQ